MIITNIRKNVNTQSISDRLVKPHRLNKIFWSVGILRVGNRILWR